MSLQVKRYFQIGGLALACSGLAAYYLLNSKSQKLSNIEKLDRDLVIKVLKEFDKQFYSLIQTIVQHAQQIIQQSQGQLSNTEIREYLIKDPLIEEQIQKIEQQVYQKYNITEKSFKQAVQTQYSDDEQIQKLQTNFQNEMDQACQGKIVHHDIEIPENLTFQKVLMIFTQITYESTSHIIDCIQQAKDQGYEQNPLQCPQLQESLNPIILEKKKDIILSEFGLDNYDDSSSKIFSCAMIKYSKNSKKFVEIFKLIETHHQKIMVSIFKGQKLDKQKIIEGYKTLIDYEIQQLEMEEIIKEEKNQEKDIQKEYNEYIHDIQEKLEHQGLNDLVVDSQNQQIIHDKEINQEQEYNIEVLESMVEENIELNNKKESEIEQINLTGNLEQSVFSLLSESKLAS